jgi:hypothetical protein
VFVTLIVIGLRLAIAELYADATCVRCCCCRIATCNTIYRFEYLGDLSQLSRPFQAILLHNTKIIRRVNCSVGRSFKYLIIYLSHTIRHTTRTHQTKHRPYAVGCPRHYIHSNPDAMPKSANQRVWTSQMARDIYSSLCGELYS